MFTPSNSIWLRHGLPAVEGRGIDRLPPAATAAVAAGLRWSDGRREVLDLPSRITLPGDSVLYVFADSGEPSGTDAPAWSSASRGDWLGGAAAPNPAFVFRRVCEKLAEFLHFPSEVAPGTTASLALWTMLTYVFPAWDAVPYLFVGGPMGSGKSRVLDVLNRLAAHFRHRT